MPLKSEEPVRLPVSSVSVRAVKAPVADIRWAGQYQVPETTPP
jgi:hypothetical protein